MPEGPELHLAACYINTLCGGLLFSGQVEKSEVSKNPEVPFASQSFRICASSRGKEVKLSLTPTKGAEERRPKGRAQPCRGAPLEEEPMDIVFRFGMSGCFKLTPANELPKHAHLRFYTQENPRRALCFIDVRRFGSWQVNGTWQLHRGPCMMLEYEKFRENVMRNLQDKAFDKPICEALLNQKYFNGIGNYLRAEILYRLKIPPFVKARTVLESLGHPEQGSELTLSKKLKLKKDNPDLLELCHLVPMEVINLEGKGYGPRETDDYYGFEKWLQCYRVPGMKTLRDNNNRTIWFQGDPGPMAPKGEKKKGKRRSLEKPDPDAAGLKVANPKRKRKCQGIGTRKGSLGTDELPKKLARKKAQEHTTRKRKASVGDSNTPQAQGKILRLRKGGKTVTVKDSRCPSNTPLAKARRHRVKKEGEPTPFTEDASKVSKLVKGRTKKLKQALLPSPVIEGSSKDSLLERGRTRQLKEQGQPAPVTEDSLKDSQLTKGKKGKLKEGEPAPVTVDSSKDSQPLPVTVDASKDSQLAKRSTRKLNKGGEPVPITKDSSNDSQLEKGMSEQLKEGEPVPATDDSWKDSRLVKGRTRQRKKEPVTVIEDSSKDSQLAKGRKRKPTKAEPAPANKDSPKDFQPLPVSENPLKDSQMAKGRKRKLKKGGEPAPVTKDSPKDFQPLPVSENPLKDSQMAKGRKRKLKKGGEPAPVTKDSPKDSQLEKGMSQQLNEEEPVQLTKDSSKNSQLEKVGTQEPLTKYSPGNSPLVKGRKLQPSTQKKAGSASGNRRNPSRVKAD